MTDAIPIEEIRTDGGTQIRDCKTVQTKIAEYATAMGEGAEFPPLTVFWDGEHYWLADGFHRLGAYNIVMQGLELPGLDIDCEVLEGTQRDAILFACGVNSTHGIQRTNADKRNAVETMLKNPLVACDEQGHPWSDRAIAKICKVHHATVAKWRAEYLDNYPDSGDQDSGGLDDTGPYLGDSPDSGERAVTRGGTTYTMKTGGINEGRQQAEAEQTVVETCVTEEKPQDPKTELETEPKTEPEQKPGPGTAAPVGVVVEFTNKWDFVYDRLKEIDRAIAALPEPHVAAAKFPETLAHSVTVERCQHATRWLQEFTRLWAARQPELRRHEQFDIEEDLNAASL